ncbi:hypothetical protein EDD21DRAFT_356775 [Dissophora ornata]|nr:hypothetical protein EDD21DRAFT_356775 [Dissophora ornata]
MHDSSFVGGLASEAKGYLDLPLNGSGHGLPLARLIAKCFGGGLSLISMEGYSTDPYMSVYRDDNHLENFPEVDKEMLAEVDVFVNELLDEYIAEDPLVMSAICPVLTFKVPPLLKSPLRTPLSSLLSDRVLELRQGIDDKAPLDNPAAPRISEKGHALFLKKMRRGVHKEMVRSGMP